MKSDEIKPKTYSARRFMNVAAEVARGSALLPKGRRHVDIYTLKTFKRALGFSIPTRSWSDR